MSTKPRNEIATMEQMKEIAQEQLKTRLYSKGADSGEVVAALGVRLALEIENLPKKIDLENVEAIQTVAAAYCAACAEVGAVPNKIGLCRAMGYSRQGVDAFINKHGSTSPAAEKLRMIFDAFAEMSTHCEYLFKQGNLWIPRYRKRRD